MADNLGQKVIRGLFWTILEQFTSQLASFCVTLVLARLLTPEDYGTVALLTVVVSISWIVVDCSFGQSLVQKKDATELDFNSVFYMSVFLSLLVYSILFVCSPLVARFYDKPELTSLLRVLAFSIVLNAINGIQSAELRKKMLFHLSFRISLTRFAMTSITGISLAFAGFGPWALVWSTIAGGVGSVMASWYFIAWRPKLMFSFSALKGLFSYGWKITVSWFLSSAFDNVYSMVIGKMHSPTDLAYLEKGRQLPLLAMSSINGTLGRVSFPAIASIQEDPDRVRLVMRRMIQGSTFLVFPAMVGMAVCATSLVPVFYGNQWDRSIPFVCIFCFSFMLYPFHTINLQTLSAIGRSDIFFKLEIVKNIIAVSLLVATYRLDVMWMVFVGAVVGGPIAVLINAYPNQRLLKYSMKMQIQDTLSSAMLCIGMASLTYPIGRLGLPKEAILALQVCVGGVVYGALAILFRVDAMRDYVQAFHQILGARVVRSALGRPYKWLLNRMRIEGV